MRACKASTVSKDAIDMAAECYALPNNLFSWKLSPFLLPARIFDCITCFESLEHVQEDQPDARPNS